jgi:hypothetical protein
LDAADEPAGKPGAAVYFTDETSTNFPQRFYRATWTP